MVDKVAVKGGVYHKGIAVLGQFCHYTVPLPKAMDVNKYHQGVPSNHNNYLAIFALKLVKFQSILTSHS